MSWLRWILMLLVLYWSYSIYRIHVPDVCSNPVRLRLIVATNKIIGFISKALTMLGITSEAATKRYLLKTLAALQKPLTEGVDVEDTVFDGVIVRIYRPAGSTGVLPGMVYYHGGGWTVGDLNMVHALTAMFAKEGNMVVASVEYRLNPEFTMRDGFDDCVTATKHFLQHAASLSVDPGRVCLAGDSAGGAFTGAISLYLRDHGFSPMPKIQLLIYPMVQVIDLQLPSFQQNRRGPFLDRELFDTFQSIVYTKNSDQAHLFSKNTHVPPELREEMANTLTNHDFLPKELLYPPYERPRSEQFEREHSPLWEKVQKKCHDPYSYPLMANDHSNLPEAYIFTGQYDVLRDDGFLYARKLREAKVKVTHYNSPIGWHGMAEFVNEIDDSRRVVMGMIDFLKENL